MPRNPIKITLANGRVIDGVSWETTPAQVIIELKSSTLKDETVVAKVVFGPKDEVLYDLERPLERDCSLVFLSFKDHEGEQVFWHSSAHILGEALELHNGCSLCYGPPIEDGFYYDADCGGVAITPADIASLDKSTADVIQKKQPFQRLEMLKEDLLKMFAYNPFKVRILTERIQEDRTTVYRCGPLIDLCRGPHVRHTGVVKALKVMKASASYWEGDATKEHLQRVYGVSFPSKAMLTEHLHWLEEAAKRDHRKIGQQQELFFFHELSPGSCFFLPKGAHIYNKLISYIREQYRVRGFQEVITPNMYDVELWKTSGHWKHYEKNMFSFEIEKAKFALKPMNCPGHCLMFKHKFRSYRELPIRFADFGVLHRNEASGALTGLTRVRRFQQDDAHIFCRTDQIEQEIYGALDFLQAVYGILGFTFKLNLSTRPLEGSLGTEEQWTVAEAALRTVLEAKYPGLWGLKEGDGAFYGPKIDITIMDALKRSHQCATIQLDFQLPQCFELEYQPEVPSADTSRPVIIHRAILGSVERVFAILLESYAGKWPFWLSPRQAVVVPIAPAFNSYAVKVQKQLHAAGYEADADVDDGLQFPKKIRNAAINQYNFILVVGEQEEKHGTANVRLRGTEAMEKEAKKGEGKGVEMTLTALHAHFDQLTRERRLQDKFLDEASAASADASVAESAEGTH